MADSDGKVRIIIDTNANEAVKALDETSEAFDKTGNAAKKSTTAYQAYENAIKENIEALKNSALAGGKNSKEFQELAKKTREYKQILNDADNAVNKATTSLLDMEVAGIKVGSALKAFSLAAVTRELFNLGKQAIQTAGEFEQLETSFKIMAGGAEAGEKLTKSLINLASKTPMTTETLARASQTLLSFGESADNIIKDLKLLGDISGGQADRFQSLALAFAQVGSTGRLTGQDLLQMVNQGFNPLQVISEKTGKSMAQLKKEMGEGKISFEMVKQAMIDATSAGGRFYGLMNEQSQTLNGLLSTNADAWQLLSKEVGQMFLPASKNAVKNMIAFGEASQKTLHWINQNRNNIGLLTKALAAGSTAFVAYRAAAGVQLATALAGTTTAINAARTAVIAFTASLMANPIFLSGAAIATSIALVTGALGNAQRQLANTGDKARELADAVKINTTETPKLIAEYRQLATQSKRTGEEEQRFIEIRNILNEQYPELLSKYGAEITKLGQLDDKIAGTIANYIKLQEVQKLVAQKNALDEKYAQTVKNKWYWNENSLPAVKNRIKANEEYVKSSNEIIAALRKINSLAEANKAVISGKNKQNGGFSAGGGSDVSSSTSSAAKQIKDAFEKAQEKAQEAEKAFKLALYKYGEGSQQVDIARKKWEDTKKAVDDVQKAYERLTATAKTPFEQLNYNIEQSRQKIISLASQPIVNIEAIRQAQTEYQGFLAQQEQINSYLQPVKGAYQGLNDKVGDLTQKLRDLAVENQIGSADWNTYKTQLQLAQAKLDNVNKSLEDNGIKINDVSKQISSSISSGLVNALRNGGNAFDAFSSLATTALQKILDKLIEMSFVTPVLNALTGGTGGTLLSLFGFKDGGVFKNGNVIPFARGGVVNQPTLFPMANGGTGLMGEAGAEAVMPLKRMSNGKLGVEADTNKNGQVVNIYNYSGASVETRKRDDNSVDVFIRRVNDALSNERTSSGFRSAYSRENNKGVQAV